MLLEAWGQAFPDGGARLRDRRLAASWRPTSSPSGRPLNGVEFTGQLAARARASRSSRDGPCARRPLAVVRGLSRDRRRGLCARRPGDRLTARQPRRDRRRRRDRPSSEPGDATDLARALRALHDDRDLAERLGVGARAEYVRNLSPGATTDRLLEIYSWATPDLPQLGQPRLPLGVRCERRRGTEDHPVAVGAGRGTRGSGAVHLVVSRGAYHLLRGLFPLQDRPWHALRHPKRPDHELRPGMVGSAEVRPGDARRPRRHRVRLHRRGDEARQGTAACLGALGLASRALDHRRPDRYRYGRLQRDAEPVRRLASPGCWRALRLRALVDDHQDRPGLPAAGADLRRDHGGLRHRPADAVRIGRRRDRVLRPDDYGRPRHARVHGRRGRDLDGDAPRATDEGPVVGAASSLARRSWR